MSFARSRLETRVLRANIVSYVDITSGWPRPQGRSSVDTRVGHPQRQDVVAVTVAHPGRRETRAEYRRGAE